MLKLAVNRSLTLEPTTIQPQFFIERRRFPRLNFTEPVRFRDVFKPQEGYSGAVARDLSAGGIRMTTHTFLAKNSRLVVLLDLPGLARPVRTISRIAWVQEESFSDHRHKCGLEFVGIAREDREAVAGHVERGGVVS